MVTAAKHGKKWRAQAAKTVDGKLVRRNFTAESKAEAEFLAERWQKNAADDAKPENRTIRQLCEDYIILREAVLSPTTIAGYRKILRCNFQDYLDVRVRDLTRMKCEQMVAEEARHISAKSVANAWGLISSALRMYGYHFEVRLPERPDKVVQVHSPSEIIPAVVGTDIELPCLLAMWCGMSMSEIRGARLSDVRNGVLYINQVLVDVDGKAVYKANGKEEKRTRAVVLPEYVQGLLPTEGEYLVTMHRNTIYRHFKNLFPDMTFHQLRHVFATTGAMLSIPSRVMQEMGGWKTNRTMEKVYQHTFTEDRLDAQRKINEYMDDILTKEEKHGKLK